ncbi:hypothetical protein DUI87_03335 [Hirundo rustica rustica]|uniref:ribonuclease H n=1 Tax=Hirundo rustica rustica TaxID=333673 RepID=A0A3M0L408_HIRRU|nr:hypothetical protein DUI87_03335 [Hirundo rustica rustica]
MSPSAPTNGDLLSKFAASTRGSAGVDVCTAESVVTDSDKLHLVPLDAFGPLGDGMSAFLMGRSSATILGIMVHLGLIDVDFSGTEDRSQGDGSFGSTGPPQVHWTAVLTKDHPETLCTVSMACATQSEIHLRGFLDTGADWYLSSLLSPVRAAVGEAIILHYTDDVLVCAPNDDLLSRVLDPTIDSLVAAGFELQEEKIQRMPPWKYLGLEIGKRTIVPQKLVVKNNIKTLADVQLLCGSLNWSPPVQKNDQATGTGSRIDPEARTRIRELAGCDFECIHIPNEINLGQITKAMLEHLLHENEALQFALDSYTEPESEPAAEDWLSQSQLKSESEPEVD